ncbi:MAG: serine--tRNA ligase [Alphaproteobacteria bacterium]|nr:serine--tRNA ligase [Alphaproteobacteria bacterium]
MHDIRFVREQAEAFDEGLKRRGLPPMSAEILKADSERRSVQTEMQELQAKRNEASKQIGEIKRKGGNADEQMKLVAAMKDRLSALETAEKELAAKVQGYLCSLPNILFPEVPPGVDDSDAKEVRRFGEQPKIAAPKEHYELGEALGMMDFERAAKLSGARFTVLQGQLALLERALGNFMLDTHTQEFGYLEVSPPLLVKDEIMFGVGQLPKFADDMFFAGRTKSREDLLREALTYAEAADIDALKKGEMSLADVVANAMNRAPVKEDLWLVTTAEVPLTNLVNNEILEKEKLPLRFTARTPCFRSEAGSAGKDTRGMLRQHQFYKVELVSITAPEKSVEEHERMASCAETILKRLELPFRTVMLATGDTGFCSKKTYDLEVWLPGQNRYREISSCSNCGDFQARRMNARCRAAGDKQTEFVHTLNGSGIAIGRALIAVMENYQQPDGSIVVPNALRKYMNGLERIG